MSEKEIHELEEKYKKMMLDIKNDNYLKKEDFETHVEMLLSDITEKLHERDEKIAELRKEIYGDKEKQGIKRALDQLAKHLTMESVKQEVRQDTLEEVLRELCTMEIKHYKEMIEQLIKEDPLHFQLGDLERRVKDWEGLLAKLSKKCKCCIHHKEDYYVCENNCFDYSEFEPKEKEAAEPKDYIYGDEMTRCFRKIIKLINLPKAAPTEPTIEFYKGSVEKDMEKQDKEAEPSDSEIWRYIRDFILIEKRAEMEKGFNIILKKTHIPIEKYNLLKMDKEQFEKEYVLKSDMVFWKSQTIAMRRLLQAKHDTNKLLLRKLDNCVPKPTTELQCHHTFDWFHDKHNPTIEKRAEKRVAQKLLTKEILDLIRWDNCQDAECGCYRSLDDDNIDEPLCWCVESEGWDRNKCGVYLLIKGIQELDKKEPSIAEKITQCEQCPNSEGENEK